MTRLATKGPRSFNRTVTVRPVLRLVTRTRDPSGQLGCAAVSRDMRKTSPLAVARPSCQGPYQLASPISTYGSIGSGRVSKLGRANGPGRQSSMQIRASQVLMGETSGQENDVELSGIKERNESRRRSLRSVLRDEIDYPYCNTTVKGCIKVFRWHESFRGSHRQLSDAS
jgi:hypothetical protein